MRAFYFDTTYLCKLHWSETGSGEVSKLAANADVLSIGMHGGAEFYTAGFRKLREGATTLAALRLIFAQFEYDLRQSGVRLLPITANMVAQVAETLLAAPKETYLRGADALHLASAAQNGFVEIYSNDRHLLAAAPLFGLRGINVIS